MLTVCSEPGCMTIVMGGACVVHERAEDKDFVRGRPFTPSPSRALEQLSATFAGNSWPSSELSRGHTGHERISSVADRLP